MRSNGTFLNPTPITKTPHRSGTSLNVEKQEILLHASVKMMDDIFLPPIITNIAYSDVQYLEYVHIKTRDWYTLGDEVWKAKAKAVQCS